MKVCIAFSYNDKLFSRLIRFATGGKFSHCGILIDNVITDATKGIGVNTMPYSAWRVSRKGKRVEFIDVDVPNLDAGLEWLKSVHGAPYDIGYIKQIINPFLGKNKYYDDDSAYKCSELVCEFLVKCGLHEFGLQCLKERGSPESLHQALSVYTAKQ